MYNKAVVYTTQYTSRHAFADNMVTRLPGYQLHMPCSTTQYWLYQHLTTVPLFRMPGGFWVVFKDRMLSLKAVMQYTLLSINPTSIIVLINGLVAITSVRVSSGEPTEL